jgi:hypothetical protein
MKAGVAGKSRITLRAKGAKLPMPTLPLAQAVAVQLKNDAEECWGATYSTFQRNEAGQYKARSDSP